ncbi:MAG: hypothetical protein WA086_08785 [Ideonella sp.]
MQKTPQLIAAQAALVEAQQQLAAINAQSAAAVGQAERARTVVSEAQSLRTERVGFLARLMRGGKTPTGREPEVAALSQKLDQIEEHADAAALVAEAAGRVQADLQAQAMAIHERMPALAEAEALARFMAARADIEANELPAFRQAAEAFAAAHARLAGRAKAHCELAQQARERFGVSLQGVGTPYPLTSVDVAVVGFGVDLNRWRIDVADQINTAHQAALQEFRA